MFSRCLRRLCKDERARGEKLRGFLHERQIIDIRLKDSMPGSKSSKDIIAELRAGRTYPQATGKKEVPAPGAKKK